MKKGKLYAKRILAIACAAGCGASASADDSSSSLTIAQTAVLDMQQTDPTATAGTSNPSSGNLIDLSNPASALVPASLTNDIRSFLADGTTLSATASANVATVSFQSASPSFTLPPPRDPITPGPALPPNVTGYNIVDLNPAGWASSQLSGITGGQSVGFVQTAGGTNIHAAFWSTATASIADLQPAGTKYNASHLYGLAGSQIVGFATLSSGSHDHAMLWTVGQGTNSIDLNPSTFSSSYAKGTTGLLQVGYGFFTATGASHALLWSGTASTFVDLNSVGFFASEALDISGNNIVGDAEFFDTGGVELHAMVWDATTHIARDINPTTVTVTDSCATAISGTVAGGYGTDATTGSFHALYWSSLSGTSAVDLNPRGFSDSQVTAVDSNVEVGFGHLSNDTTIVHALLWTGAAATFVDLNQYLPSNYGNAEAQGIDANGNIVGYAFNNTTGAFDAVEWTPIAATPEPATLAPLSILLGGWVTRRRKRAHS